jgi:hypothetical protein
MKSLPGAHASYFDAMPPEAPESCCSQENPHCNAPAPIDGKTHWYRATWQAVPADVEVIEIESEEAKKARLERNKETK